MDSRGELSTKSLARSLNCIRDTGCRWCRLLQRVTGVFFGLVEWPAEENRPFRLDGLSCSQELKTPQVGDRAHMLRTIYTFKEGQAGLIDQAVRQERIA